MGGEITEITVREIQLQGTQRFVLVRFGRREEGVRLSISRVRGWQARRGFLTLTSKEFEFCCRHIFPGRVVPPEFVVAVGCEYRPKGYGADIGIPLWCGGAESVFFVNDGDQELDVSAMLFVFVDHAHPKDSL